MTSAESEQFEVYPTLDSAELATDPEHLARLIFLSYRFSQGGIGTQNRMLLFIEEHHQPELFSDMMLPLVQPRVTSMVSSYFLNEKTHPATAVPWDSEYPGDFIKTPELVTNELAGLFERFSTRDQMHLFAHDSASLAMSIISMDADYLTRPGGRSGHSEALKVKVSPYTRDAYMSLYIRHGVLKESTHSVEYDDIFSQASSHETLRQLDEPTLKQLLRVIEIYTHEHNTVDERLVNLQLTCLELIDGK
ncbi:hypothetical protein KA047_00295 [Candidatus Saccharibacteria bacterium]|nr:hypothetical protein [Candidatus Saccharibacteria bacterium]